MANYPSPNTRKRGRTSSELSVRLFLLDPEKEITKATKKICSKKAIEQLMQKGCGPPRPEHCAKKDKVEFSLELTNEQFKQKIIEIYPNLENACFVIMKAGKDSKLEELNPDGCCFRCYTPENVYHSERGQGRLYIRKIAENEIPQCTHGESPLKRMRAAAGGCIPILPKPVSAVSTSTAVGTESKKSAVTQVAMPTNHQLPLSGNPGIEPRVLLLPAGSMAGLDSAAAESSQPAQSTVNTIPQGQLQSSTIAGTELTPPARSSVDIVRQSQLPLSTIVSQIASTPPVYSPDNVVPQSQLASIIHGTESRPLVLSTNAMTTPSHALSPSGLWTVPTTTMVPSVTMGTLFPSSSTTVFGTNAITTPGPSISSSGLWTVPTSAMASSITMATFPAAPSPSTTVFSTDAMSTLGPSLLPSLPWTVQTTTVVPSINVATSNLSPMSVSRSLSPLDFSSVTMMPQGSNIVPGTNFATSLDIFQTDVNSGETSSTRGNEVLSDDPSQTALLFGDVNFQVLLENLRSGNGVSSSIVNVSDGRRLQSSGLHGSADTTVESGPFREMLTNDTRNWTSLLEQENLNITEPKLHIDAFFEHVKSTGILEISLAVINNDDLLKKLNESTINIHTVEIQTTCKVHQVLRNYSLPSCLKLLRINGNNLDYEDIFALVRSLRSNSLLELDFSHTKFTESSFSCFVSVLIYCSDLKRLSLTDNGLTKQELNCLIPAFKCMKNLENLNLSKNNLTETQANDILQKHDECKSIASLDLSQNALQGNEVINGICKLESLEELNLSHNHIKFCQLRNVEEQSDNFPINTRIISLSSNHMTPDDICRFSSLIRSDLLKLNLDSNHVGNSIWSLCSLRIKHLKVLSLANTDICGPAVEGLPTLLSSVRELEELDLSSNNLMLEDFRHLQSPLSNLTQLKKLNLSNNPEGITVILQKILPSLKYLEELRLSNLHLNGVCNKFFKSLKFLKGLRYLDLSINAIGPSGTRALANILKEFPLLEGLDMSKTCIKEDDIGLLCKDLVPLNKLRYLNLSGNRVDIEVLGDDLFLPPALEKVILSDIIHGGKLFANMIPLQHRLRSLHLSKIKLRPCDVEALAAMLSSFRLLQELVLTDVNVADTKCEKIFSAIKLLKNLKKLDLGDVKVDDGKAFFDMLSSLSFLEEIVFPDVLMHDDGVTGFFNALTSLRYLKNLDLSGTGIYKTEVETLARVLPSLQLLEKLVLGVIDFDNGSQKQLFDSVGKLKYLKELCLERTKIIQTGAVALVEVLSSLQMLEKLVLGEIDSDDESQKHLFYFVGKLKYLKELDLESTTITQIGAHALAEVLPSPQLLEKLVFREIDFDTESQKHLFYSVGKLKYLKKLDLGSTTITQTEADALAKSLPSMQLLEKLVLGGIEFDNGSGKQLFHAIAKLKYLKELCLEGITITRTGAVALAKVLPSLQLLENLGLGEIDVDNGRQKQLFLSVGKLNYLKELDLSSAMISQTGAVTLAEVLPSLQLLEKLVLGKIDFDNGCAKQLFHSVGKLKCLKELCYSEMTKITQASAVALVKVLPSLQLLEKLELGNIDFDNGGQKQLFHAVGKLKYLKELGLQCTMITQTGADALAKVLPSLQILERLALDGIDFDKGSKKHALFHAVGKLKYLKDLELGRIEVSQTGAVTLAEVLPLLQLLEKLVLVEVDFDNGSETQLFAAVGKLKYLEALCLERTEITQTGTGALAEVLSSLQLLEELLLVEIYLNNGCEKQLFCALGSLKCLKVLNLKNTKITYAGATTLTDVLPILRKLRRFEFPEVESDENETSSHEESDENETPESRLEAAARLVPGLEIY